MVREKENESRQKKEEEERGRDDTAEINREKWRGYVSCVAKAQMQDTSRSYVRRGLIG